MYPPGSGVGVDKGGLVIPGRPDSEGRGSRRWGEQPTDFIQQVDLHSVKDEYAENSFSGASTRLEGSLLHIQE